MSPEGGLLAPLAHSFGVGVLTALTPCVYPLIPVTLALFDDPERTSTARRAGHGAIFVLGMAIVFSALGVFSAASGAVFGAFLSHPAVIIALLLLMLALYLHTLDIVPLGVLSRLQSRCASIEQRGVVGLLLAGGLSGFIAAPCVGPVLAQVLTTAALSQDLVWGGALLFVYALGFGSLFFLLSLFPQLLQKLPRPGAWLNVVKIAIAGLLLAVAWQVVRPVIAYELPSPSWIIIVGSLGAAIAVGRYLGHRTEIKVVTSCLIGFLAVPLIAPHSSLSNTTSGIPWESLIERAFEKARERPEGVIMIDFTAEWCAQCRELAAHTFPAPEVVAAAAPFVPLKVDMTDPAEEVATFAARYQVVGLPVILFIRADGSEIPNSRITGFIGAGDFAAHLNKIMG